jgi:Phage terminase-like protein, large subunit
MTDHDQFWFDERAATVAVAFFEKLLMHTKGEWAGQPFKLQEWQRDGIIRPLFGWKREDGTRRYRRAYIEIPRKNGKSTLSAGIALYLLFADDEPGAEVYSAAADRDQARIVFDEAKRMVEANQTLAKLSQAYKVIHRGAAEPQPLHGAIGGRVYQARAECPWDCVRRAARPAEPGAVRCADDFDRGTAAADDCDDHHGRI